MDGIDIWQAAQDVRIPNWNFPESRHMIHEKGPEENPGVYHVVTAEQTIGKDEIPVQVDQACRGSHNEANKETPVFIRPELSDNIGHSRPEI